MKRREFIAGATCSALTAGTAEARVSFYSGYPHQITGWTAKHFKPEEFASKGNGFVSVSQRMVASLDRVRTAVGHPIYITSGYRDPAYNARVGGVKYSRHLLSDAVDINLRGLSSLQRHALMWHLLAEGFTSFGSYASHSFMHTDMRPNARIWHGGTGTHPAWFRRALADWGWQRDLGATRTHRTRIIRT
ncbi:D-Ala-D-Ala carboxypeptidase family metallohydrolase [Shimia sp. MMG029]|uniref:D-Ala-D-Ala carboxypeptidase family metallohydrolase n=1 Tax=Shimia sp. MMG029 TaxID=3021978 RepID=UPI0022FE0B93|nr:D-Ala-D-Ala carboxypeptidase family metallohydrolase [Shimia sp. MMG029]MDA5556053.1 D-Ala-D-Ala carboxypeptidase family metallohydrolase [Shimia sp. MMG029]